MNHLLLHSQTKSQLEAFAGNPSHALIITGAPGMGKFAAAETLAETVLGLEPGSFARYSYGLVLRPQDSGKAISIDSIRELERFLSLKVPKQSLINRVVIIEDSHLLTHEAQNALLKSLEEPPKGSLFILTASHPQSLLPTIRSRGQVIHIKRPGSALTETYFQGQKHDLAKIKRVYVMSGGLPGLMYALLSEAEHPLLSAAERARQLLSQNTYQRLLHVDELSKQRDLAADVCLMLEQMARVSLQTAQGQVAQRWQIVLQAGYYAREALQTNAQPKLVLTKLMLEL